MSLAAATALAGAAQPKSLGSLEFGPAGVLFAADPKAAAVVALELGKADAKAGSKLDIKMIDEKIAALLGTKADQININDLAVDPQSGIAYLSVSRGLGQDAGYSLPASGLDDVSIWNRALTTAELWEIYAEGRANTRSLGEIIAAKTPDLELEITAITFTSPGQIRLTFNGKAGEILALFGSNDLKDWTEIDDSIPATGPGSIHEFTDQEAIPQALRFYRLQEID
jgi:hypothetical protein